MLYLDIPSIQQIKALNEERSEACVSLYLKTTSLTQDMSALIELGNLQKEMQRQLEESGFDKRKISALNEQIEALKKDEKFWKYQASALAILLTPESIKTFRLPTKLDSSVHISDRFHLKPLLRAVTFPHACYVLALSENQARLIEVYADGRPEEINIPNMPESAAAVAGKSTLNDRSATGKIQGDEGQNIRLTQYARAVNNALHPVLSGSDVPLILAASGRLEAVYPSVNTYPNLLPEVISTSPDRLKPHELDALARPILDASYERQVHDVKDLFAERGNSGRAKTDLTDVARAATYGAIDTLLIDFNDEQTGLIDEKSGKITKVEEKSAEVYGLVDEIAGRALSSGARVLSVRKGDIPANSPVAAILRFAV